MPQVAATPCSGFDKLARPYRWMEYLTFGPYLCRARTAFLEHAATSKKALVLGDGDGRFTAELMRRNGQIQVTVVDGSQAMLRQLSQRIHKIRQSHRLTVCHQDVLNFPLGAEQYDLIATHFFLDCLTVVQVEVLSARLCPALTSDGLWLVSDFAIPKSGVAAVLSRSVVRSLYMAFQLLANLPAHELPDYPAVLSGAGLYQLQSVAMLGGLLTSEVWKPNRNLGSAAAACLS